MATCSGYKGVHYCKEAGWSNGLPDSMFTESILKKGRGQCKICKKVCDRKNNPITNGRKPFYYAVAGGYKAYYALSDAMRKLCRISADYGGVIPPPAKRVVSYDNTAPERKSVTSKRFERDRNVVNHVRSMYDGCVMPGCGYRDVDVAHIHALKHGAKDVPENCIPLCPNHHRDLDKGRIHLQFLEPQSLAVRAYHGAYLGEIRSKHDLDEPSIEKAMEALAPYMRAA